MTVVAERRWVADPDDAEPRERDGSQDAATGIAVALLLGLLSWSTIGLGLWLIF